MDGAVVAQAFLNGGGDQGRILLQFSQLVGVSQQRQQAVADQAGGGLVAGLQQKGADAEQLGLAEPVPPGLDRDQIADQIGPRVPPALVEQPAQVMGQLQDASVGAPGDGGVVAAHPFHEDGQVVGPALEPVPVLGGHPQQLGNRDGWQRVGEFRDDVQTSFGPDRLQKILGDGLNSGPQALQSSRREGPVDQGAQAGVVGGVVVLHPGGEEPSQRLHFRLNLPRQLSQQQAEPLRREARVVLQGKPDIVVAGQNPTVGPIAPVDRVFRTQLMVEGVGVGQPAPAEQSIFVQ